MTPQQSGDSSSVRRNPENELCDNCGKRLGQHGADSNACPGSTSFYPTGRYEAAQYGGKVTP